MGEKENFKRTSNFADLEIKGKNDKKKIRKKGRILIGLSCIIKNAMFGFTQHECINLEFISLKEMSGYLNGIVQLQLEM